MEEFWTFWDSALPTKDFLIIFFLNLDITHLGDFINLTPMCKICWVITPVSLICSSGKYKCASEWRHSDRTSCHQQGPKTDLYHSPAYTHQPLPHIFFKLFFPAYLLTKDPTGITYCDGTETTTPPPPASNNDCPEKSSGGPDHPGRFELSSPVCLHSWAWNDFWNDWQWPFSHYTTKISAPEGPLASLT